MCNYLITLPVVCFNVFVVPSLVKPGEMFWAEDRLVRIWQGVLLGSVV